MALVFVDRPTPGPSQRHLVLLQGGAGGSRPSPAVYRRRRLVALALAVAVVVVAIAGARAVLRPFAQPVSQTVSQPSTQPSQPVSGRGAPGAAVHVVEPGDTVWTVAAAITGDGDVRATVDALVQGNGGTVRLEPGDVLVLPS